MKHIHTNERNNSNVRIKKRVQRKRIKKYKLDLFTLLEKIYGLDEVRNT